MNKYCYLKVFELDTFGTSNHDILHVFGTQSICKLAEKEKQNFKNHNFDIDCGHRILWNLRCVANFVL